MDDGSLHATPSLTEKGHVASPGNHKLVQCLVKYCLPSHASWVDNVSHHVI